MTHLYLIAHKVRGEPAFDIAEHMTCPSCEGTNEDCLSCEGIGHWWIIPTSGHRAYPYWDCALEDLFNDANVPDGVVRSSMPSDLRDHYTTTREQSRSLLDLVKLTQPAKTPVNFPRRI